MRHAPIPAKIITPPLLRRVLHVISHIDQFPTLRFLLITMFMFMLRQSNFLSSNVASFDPTRQLTRNDVTLSNDGLHIMVKWEKKIQSARANEGLVLPCTADYNFCPVRAYRSMLRLVLTRGKADALIMYKDYNPMTLSFTQAIWKATIQAMSSSTQASRF